MVRVLVNINMRKTYVQMIIHINGWEYSHVRHMIKTADMCGCPKCIVVVDKKSAKSNNYCGIVEIEIAELVKYIRENSYVPIFCGSMANNTTVSDLQTLMDEINLLEKIPAFIYDTSGNNIPKIYDQFTNGLCFSLKVPDFSVISYMLYLYNKSKTL